MVATIKNKLNAMGKKLISRPMFGILPLSIMVITLEVAQKWPEFFSGGHVVSVFTRAIGYSLIAALIFNWVIVEIPQRNRRRAAYIYHQQSFEMLLMVGPASLVLYQSGSVGTTEELDVWDRRSVVDRARALNAWNPVNFGPERRRFMSLGIVGVQHALDGIKSSQFFLDADVAHALALFPGTIGLNQLQVGGTDGGPIAPERDAHIVWELSEAARRLYRALNDDVPYIDFSIGFVTLENGELIEVPESFLLR